MTQVPRPAAVAPRVEVGDASRVVSPLNTPPPTRPSEVLGQASQSEKIITGEVKAGGETAYVKAIAQQAEINRQLPAELLTKELPRAEVIQLMGGKSVAEVRELWKLSGNVNVLELNKTLDAIGESRFVAKPNESIGDFVGRFNAYQGRFGAFARGASPQGSVDQDFWPKAYSLTPEQLASDTTLNPSLRGPLSGALKEAMKRGFQAKPGENIGDFLN